MSSWIASGGGAMGAADETPMSDVLLEFCGEA